ncbi:MAG: hypothetical protein CME65_10050 [Halobacteriovoraceae bacterium]|nr:hypothetical protein [Halobacteriovoraceae bacterium]|tara:strand:- start:6306 stop:7619 length:1314 start_codon:yes stop_codon:yes gene_type:complete
MSNQIKKAVSIVLRHKNLVYYIKRNNFLRHFPGYIAFPGGKVEKIDEQTDDELLAAVIREAKEELGIDIPNLIRQGSLSTPKKIALATTPDFNPYRFETHFFLIESKKKMRLKSDEEEFSESAWISPYEIVRKFNSGECLLVPPVRKIFELLSEPKSINEFIDFDLEPKEGIPQVESIKNLLQVMPLSETLPPAQRTNCFVIGDQTKFIVDPSPKDTNEYRKLLASLNQYTLLKIIITHHHGDHHKYAPDLAKHFELPLYMSKYTRKRLLEVFGENYLADCEVIELKEGDSVGKWIGQDVNVFEIPGHDQGHIGLAPEKLNWFIVGDLFQGIGTVVVGGEEGDMKLYFKSLKKVIDLNPQCVIPSHGIPLGGVDILEKTLEHRQYRENQILDLYEKNPDLEYILKTIYFDIPRHLHPYALANIKAHLTKLEQEGRIS